MSVVEVYFSSNDLSYSYVHTFLATLLVKGKKNDRKNFFFSQKKLNKKENGKKNQKKNTQKTSKKNPKTKKVTKTNIILYRW